MDVGNSLLASSSLRPYTGSSLIPTYIGIIPVFPSTRTSSSVLTSSHSDEFVFGIALLNVEKNRHLKLSRLKFCFRRFHRQHINIFVLLIKASLVDGFDGLNIEFVFSFDVFNVLLYLGKIGSKGTPALRGQDGPEIDTTSFDTDSCHKWPMGMPLDI
jgi:hypothetical protein